jgi:hypothetical protein
VEQIDADTWQVAIDKVYSPGHELGFSPDGRHLVMMNNGLEKQRWHLRQLGPRSEPVEKDQADH